MGMDNIKNFRVEESEGAIPSSTPEHEESSASKAASERRNRAINNDQWADQADERNQRRNLLKKLFGAGKVNGMDILREEADRVNTLVDQRVERGDGTVDAHSASEEILQSPEFNYAKSSAFQREDNSDRAEFRELLRSVDFAAEEQLNKGNAGMAFDIVDDLIDRSNDREERKYLENSLDMLVADKLETFIAAHDVQSMVNLFSERRWIHVNLDFINKLPQEVLSVPRVRSKFENIIKATTSGADMEERLAHLESRSRGD